MKTLVGEYIQLRALEQADLDFLYTLENDESLWEVSNTTNPYSKFVLQQYLDNSHRDIYDVKQLRLVICGLDDDRAMGFIDIFDFEPKHRRAGVGIVIFDRKDRGKGYAAEALELLKKYAMLHLNLHQLYANISEENQRSIHLFEKLGFRKAGVKKDWIVSGDQFKDESLYQLILTNY